MKFIPRPYFAGLMFCKAASKGKDAVCISRDIHLSIVSYYLETLCINTLYIQNKPKCLKHFFLDVDSNVANIF